MKPLETMPRDAAHPPARSPAVSVVIPTRDRRVELEACLESLAAQTRPGFEVIVVDDASSDGTSATLDAFAARHPRIPLRRLRHEQPAGSNASRNHGIRVARGDLVAFIDSDAVAEPTWLERLVAAFDSPAVGAATGLVTTPPPENVFELTYRGTNRIPGRGHAPRLSGANMCIRRPLLLAFPLDEDLACGCDEEGLFLRLRAAGWAQRVVPDAVVCHRHRFDGVSFFRHARVGGAATAWLIYKYRLPPRLDLLPFVLAYVTLPLGLVDLRLLALPAAFAAGAGAALAWNELSRKGKTIGETLRCFPTLVAYYHVRLLGYAMSAIRLHVARNGIARVDLDAVPPRDDEPAGDERHFSTTRVEADLRGHSVRGGVTNLLGMAGQFTLTVAFTSVLARLLTPADFGLVAMVTSVAALVLQFVDLGLAESTVQRTRVNQRQISTLFWITVVIGAGLSALTAALGPVLAWFYHEPRLIAITLAIAPAGLLGGLAVQHRALLQRQMRFGMLAIIAVAAPTLGFIGAIGAARLGAGYWAQVVFVVTTPAVVTAGVWIGCRWRPGRPARDPAIRSMLAFGTNLSFFRGLRTFTCHLDKILVGRLAGVAALGMYSKAYYLFDIPTQRLNEAVSAVAASALSRLREDPARYRAFYTRGVLLMAALSMPVAVFGFVAADRIILTVLGDQWHEAIPVFRALAPMVLMGILAPATGWVYVSLGRTSRQLRWGLVETAGLVAAFAIGARWGAIGIALAFSLALTVLRPIGVAYCLRGTFVRGADLLRALWPPAAASAAAALVTWLVHALLFPAASDPTATAAAPPFVALIVDFALFAAAYAAAWFAFPGGRRIVQETLEMASDLRGGGRTEGLTD